MNKNHHPVFISSTFEDLKEYRLAVQNVLVRLETVVKGMEHFGSSPNSPKDECLKIVNESKIFILIVGTRYGYIDNSSGKSMVEIEYLEAKKSNLPILVYVLNTELQPVLPKYVDIGEKADKLKLFKESLVKNHLCSLFTTPEDLALKVAQDLPEQLNKVGVDVKINLKDEIVNEKDSYSILKKFILRPKSTPSVKAKVKIQISSGTKFTSASYRDCLLYGVPPGDTFFFSASFSANETHIGDSYFYAFGKVGDIINDVIGKDATLNAIVRTESIVRETYYKTGRNIADKIPELLKGLIIEDIIE